MMDIRLWIGLLVGVLGAGSAVAEPFVLVRDGKPQAKVLVADEHPSVKAAVDDLVHYVEKISGATLEVVQGKEDLLGPTLHLGRTTATNALTQALESLETDGFVMRRGGEDAVIAGNIPQGTCNGIVTLIQDLFGVRWYFPGDLWEIVPSKDTLTIEVDGIPIKEHPLASGSSRTIGELQIVRPSFLGRQRWGGQLPGPHQHRMRMTLNGVALPYIGTGHAISRIINDKNYGHKPEYFAYFDGKRNVGHDVHPCFTHPDMLGIFMDYVKKGESSLGVNDNMTTCRCERCLKLDGYSEPYMGMTNISESYFQLIQKVAAETYKWNPTHRLGVFAYQLTNVPPKTVDHLGPNVSLVLCQDTSQYFDDNVWRVDFSHSREWAEKVDHIRFYDYIGLSHWTPRYFPELLDMQLKHLAEIGVEGYGTHSGSMTDSSMPMFYLMYQLLWDAEQDADAIVEKMITDLYRESADPIREFYDHWEHCWMRQTKSRWLNAIDNFRGEMKLFTMEDFEKGRALLEEAAAMAKDEKVKERVAFLKAHNDYSYAAAHVYFETMKAMEARPATPQEAEQLAVGAYMAWLSFSNAYDATDHLPSKFLAGWASKTFRVRMWSLKQQVRDSLIAPFIRWMVDHELELTFEEIAKREKMWHAMATKLREQAEEHVTEKVGAAYRLPRAGGVKATLIPRLPRRKPGAAAKVSWEKIPTITTCDWVYRDRSPTEKPGKYDEPLNQHYMDAPAAEDHAITWQAAWTRDALHLRIEVRDDIHTQKRDAENMWEHDSVQIALNFPRDEILYDVHSWTYLWGGYRGTELEFGLGVKDDGETLQAVWHVPEVLEAEEANRRIRGRASREGDRTIYVARVPWSVIPGFHAEPKRSLGISLAVNEVDEGDRRISAEYGGGVVRAKRPGEFAAIRLGTPKAMAATSP